MDMQLEERLPRELSDYVDLMNRERKHLVCGMMAPEFIECDPVAMTQTYAYPAQVWEQNPDGVLHGGIITTMLDTTIGALTHIITGKLTPTISLNTSYLRPAPGDGRIIVKAYVTKMGRTLIYTRGELWEEKHPEKLIATAEGTYRNMT